MCTCVSEVGAGSVESAFNILAGIMMVATKIKMCFLAFAVVEENELNCEIARMVMQYVYGWYVT